MSRSEPRIRELESWPSSVAYTVRRPRFPKPSDPACLGGGRDELSATLLSLLTCLFYGVLP